MSDKKIDLDAKKAKRKSPFAYINPKLSIKKFNMGKRSKIYKNNDPDTNLILDNLLGISVYSLLGKNRPQKMSTCILWAMFLFIFCVTVLAIGLYFAMHGSQEWLTFFKASFLYTSMVTYVIIMHILIAKLPFVNKEAMRHHGYARMWYLFIGGIPTAIIGYIINATLMSCCEIDLTDWLLLDVR